MRLFASWILIGVLLPGSSRLATNASGQERASEPSRAAAQEQLRAAPAFTLSNLKGRRNKSASLRESIVVLDFWATWCEPCVREIPSFNHLQEKYGAQGVKVIGLAVQSGWPKDIKRFVVKNKMHYTILVGNDDTVADFDVISFPTTFIIVPGWRVYKKYTGAYEGKDAAIERDIKALLSPKQ
jgi:cytochrome c biogenesis protein CcmG, thiol:disulfide interchange protein DsbE